MTLSNLVSVLVGRRRDGRSDEGVRRLLCGDRVSATRGRGMLGRPIVA